MPHDHDHHDHDHSHLGAEELRVRALQSLLTQKGYLDPAALDRIIETYETEVGPHNGAQVVAKASQLAALNQAWDEAAHATPHGQPIELPEAVWSRLD